MRDPLTRRDALRAAAAAGLAGLTSVAGCAGAPAAEDAETTPTAPTAADTATTPDGSTEATGDATASAIPETATVGMSCYSDEDDYFFRPALTRVEPGTTVSFGVGTSCRQQTLAYHPDNDAPLRIPEGADSWSSPVMQGSMGGTFEVTLERPGVYDYFGLHETFGQVGSIIVGSPDPDNQPGLAPPQDSIPAPAREQLAVLNERTRTHLSDRDT